MYICPICNRKFDNPNDVAKHSLSCWREHNPNHRSKPAPQSENITQVKVNDDIMNFFGSFNNAGSNA